MADNNKIKKDKKEKEKHKSKKRKRDDADMDQADHEEIRIQEPKEGVVNNTDDVNNVMMFQCKRKTPEDLDRKREDSKSP
jgi:hypothetical protein